MYTVLLPGLGYKTINEKIIKLQPWNYLIQIAEELALQGYKVRVVPISTALTSKVSEKLGEKNILVNRFSGCGSLRGDVIVPIAVGFFTKVQQILMRCSSRNTINIIGALTTPILDLDILFRNYFKIKISRTEISANKILLENIALRVKKKIIEKYVKIFIISSIDYKYQLDKLFSNNNKLKIVKFLPKVDVPQLYIDKVDVEPDVFTITYFGPFTEERGVISLIKAYISLQKAIKNNSIKTRLKLLIRNINNYTLFKKLISKYKGYITLHVGFMERRRLFRELLKSSIVIFPYRIIPSTIPISFIEALVLRRPLVLASCLPGMCEHVKNYLDKIIQPVFNINDIKEILLRYVIDCNLYKRVLKRQHTYVYRFEKYIKNSKITLS